MNKTSYRKVKQRLLVVDKNVDPSSVGCAGRRFSACICGMCILIYIFAFLIAVYTERSQNPAIKRFVIADQKRISKKREER